MRNHVALSSYSALNTRQAMKPHFSRSRSRPTRHLRKLFFLSFFAMAFYAAPLPGADDEVTLFPTAAYVSRHVYRGVERSTGAWQAALDGAIGDWRGRFWSSRPFDSAAPGELRSALGYVWQPTDSVTVEAWGTHFWYVDQPQKGAAAHSFEADLRLVWTRPSGWRVGLETGYDIRFRSRLVEGSLAYDLALPGWGTYLEGRIYAGHVAAKDVLPDTVTTGLRDAYTYFGADLRLPYRISYVTTVAVEAHYAATVNQDRSWSPQLAGSGGRGWGGATIGFEF